MVLRGRYHLEFLAQGGMGSAWRGVCGQRSYFVKSCALADSAHLRREAQILQRLPLGNFPRFVEVLEEEGQLYLVSEFLEGATLEQEVERDPWGRPEDAELRRLSLELCALLEVLHSLRPPVLFLDLKPSNVLRVPDGRLFLVDFGISRPCPGLHLEGTFEGSPQTASPEHYTGKLDRRSDLFTLAATVHYVATRGQAARAVPAPFPSARDYHPGLSEELDAWLQRCLALNPAQRYGDVAAARRALEAPAAPPRKKSWLPWGK
jgi:serine/threonine-protein kinase